MGEQDDNGAAEVQAMLQDVDQQILTQGYTRLFGYVLAGLTVLGVTNVHLPEGLPANLAVQTLLCVPLAIHWLRTHTSLKNIAALSHDAGKVAGKVAGINAAPAAAVLPDPPAPPMKVVPSAVPVIKQPRP